MTKDHHVYVSHIVESIDLVERYIGDASFEDFLSDTEMQDAVIRRLEIIGEASKQLIDAFKTEHPHIPWKNIMGMRDKLIHEYFGVDLALVWEVMRKDLPDLKKSLLE